MRTPPRLAILAFGALATSALADNLACQGTGMDWYINMVGETPCLTYQKLRQICNSQFAVGVMDVNTPPDACTDQVSTCCCNTVAFALSMLCLNCQQNISTSTGLDAGAGAYQIYLDQGTSTSCANPQSDKLPADIQTAVCNEKVKIADDLYSNGWPDGSWFYVYTRDTLTKDNIVANNNSFTHCASTTLSSSSSSQHPSSSSSATSTSASAKPSGTAETATAPPSTKLGSGAIAGLAVGVALLLGLVGAGAWWWWRRRGRRGGGAVGPGGVFGQPETAAVDESLVAHAYTYSDAPQTGGAGGYGSATEGAYSDAQPGNYSDGHATGSYTSPSTMSYTHPATGSDFFVSEGGSSSAPGVAGLEAAGAGAAYASTGRRGLHTAGQPSTSSGASLPNPYGGSAVSGGASVTDSASSERRDQAGPLPRKRRAAAPGASSATSPPPPPPPGASTGRAGSEEPFLEAEEDEHARAPWLDVEPERHLDAGPVGDVGLGRSPSGRLPPAYGEQM